MRPHLLAAMALVAVAMSSAGPAHADAYPYCSREGFGVGQSCSFETLAQCEAAVKGMGTDCFKNPRYTAPVVVAPAPQPPPAAAPKKRRATQPAGTKS
jgi:hypothetical protein